MGLSTPSPLRARYLRYLGLNLTATQGMPYTPFNLLAGYSRCATYLEIRTVFLCFTLYPRMEIVLDTRTDTRDNGLVQQSSCE
jgi:hypothetical protein